MDPHQSHQYALPSNTVLNRNTSSNMLSVIKYHDERVVRWRDGLLLMIDA